MATVAGPAPGQRRGHLLPAGAGERALGSLARNKLEANRIAWVSVGLDFKVNRCFRRGLRNRRLQVRLLLGVLRKPLENQGFLFSCRLGLGVVQVWLQVSDGRLSLEYRLRC